MQKREIKVGQVYKHLQGGHRYRIDGFILNATGYERMWPFGKKLRRNVLYTQLDSGIQSAGMQYVRSERNFNRRILKNWRLKRIFELAS